MGIPRVSSKPNRSYSVLVEPERTKGISIKKEMVRKGEPTEEILKTIKEEKIDMLDILPMKRGCWNTFSSATATVNRPERCPCSIMWVKKEPGAISEEKEETL